MFRVIFHVITTIDRGGAENQLLMLAKQQINQNFEVHVFDLKGNSELENEFIEIGVHVRHELINKSTFIQGLVLRKLVSEQPTETLVHAHLPQAEIVASIAKGRQSHLVTTRHFGGRFKPSSNLLISSILGILASIRADRIIAIANSVQDILQSNKEVFRPSKIEVIHYGIDIDFFLSQKTVKDHLSLGAPITIGTISRLSPEKNVDLILKMYAELSKEVELGDLRIVGVGPLENELKALAKKLGIEERVNFLGKRSDIPEQFSELDVFVLASSFEGFGMVLLEAMAMGVRIVASRNSAIIEIIDGTDSGVLFETNNLNDFKDSIKQALAQDHYSTVQAQTATLSKFKIESNADKIMALYKTICHCS